MIVAANFPMMQQSILPHLEGVGNRTGLAQMWRWNQTEKSIRLPNGSLFWLRSADNPTSLLGADLAWLYGDEVATWDKEAYAYCVGRVRQAGFPHQVFLTFTPKGQNWAWKAFGEECEGMEIIRVHSAENPGNGEDYIDRMRRAYGEGSIYWRQEVEGDYTVFEGLVYGSFDRETQIAGPPALSTLTRVVAGVDWGWTAPGAIVVVGLDAEDRLWVLEEVYQTGKPVEWWIERAEELRDRWRVERFFCDPSDPENIAVFRTNHLRAEKAPNAVIPGIMAVGSRVDTRRLFVAPSCENVIREMGLYCWKERKGEAVPDEPEKVNDHAMDALRYGAIEFYRTGGVQSLPEVYRTGAQPIEATDQATGEKRMIYPQEFDAAAAEAAIAAGDLAEIDRLSAGVAPDPEESHASAAAIAAYPWLKDMR
jgi:phage terminase large subunit